MLIVVILSAIMIFFVILIDIILSAIMLVFIVMLIIIILSITFFYSYADCHYVQCRI
jgi:hypothetical protein